MDGFGLSAGELVMSARVHPPVRRCDAISSGKAPPPIHLLSDGPRGIRVTDPHDIDRAVREALASAGPVLLDVLTNPDEISLPPKVTAGDAWGFAVAKLKETISSHEA